MTCPVCHKPYEKTRRTELSVYVYRRRCGCPRPTVKVTEYRYDVRDVIRDEVRR